MLRVAALIATATAVFAAVAAILWQVIPPPHERIDYLAIGAVATFCSLIFIFLVVTRTWIKTDLFYKRRK